MKKRFLIIPLLIILLISNCDTSKRLEKKYLNDDLGFRLYNGIENFYYQYLKYPQTREELTEFFWDWLNFSNEYKFSSFNHYLNAKEKNEFPELENVISFLNYYGKEIKIEISHNIFTLKFRDNIIKMERDFCDDKNIFWDNKFKNYRIITYDSLGKKNKINYEDELFSIYKDITHNYSHKTFRIVDGDTLANFYLFKYSKEESFKFLCNDEPEEKNMSFLKQLKDSLDTFLVNHNEVYSIRLLIPLYYN